MTFKHLTETCVAETIGENGLSDEVLARVLMAAVPAQDRLCQLVELRCLPALSAAQSARGTGPM